MLLDGRGRFDGQSGRSHAGSESLELGLGLYEGRNEVAAHRCLKCTVHATQILIVSLDYRAMGIEFPNNKALGGLFKQGSLPKNSMSSRISKSIFSQSAASSQGVGILSTKQLDLKAGQQHTLPM